MDRFRLDGRRVVVTGASSDIGTAIALACANAGAIVIGTGRHQPRLEQTLDALGSGPHVVVPGDITVEADRTRIVEAAGEIAGLVHCAAVIGPTLLRSISPTFVEARLEVNLAAPMYLTQQFLRAGSFSAGASIVFISSLSALVGTRGFSVYSAAKAGQMAVARCLALEVAQSGMRVNCIAPGIVRTRVYEALGEAWIREQERSYPLGLGSPDDVAGTALFLLSDASRWITGQTVVLSGACSWV